MRLENYQNPIKKIEVPEVYNRKLIPNTQAFAYLTINYLQTPIYSPQQQLLILAPAVSEMLPRPFQIKLKLIDSFMNALAENSDFVVKNGF